VPDLHKMGLNDGNKYMGERVRGLRHLHQITQTQLAAIMKSRCGLLIDQNAIKRVENGEQPLRLVEASHLANIFNLTLDEFVKDKQVIKPKRTRVDNSTLLSEQSKRTAAAKQRDANGKFRKLSQEHSQ
jgi:transcriptional regulator with XRE-family HTH domain